MRPSPARRPAAVAAAIGTVLVVLLAASATALAQATPPPRRPAAPPLPPPTLAIGGYAMIGLMNFAAADSFEAIVGGPSHTLFGGGARVRLPLGGLFVDVGAWQTRAEGERAFVFEGTVFPLGIPVEITVTPIEFTAGWQFRFRRAPKFRPHVGGGLLSYGYKETSGFSTNLENVNERLKGYNLIGGAEYRVARLVSLSGEASWATVPDSAGDAGVSAVFDETDLGGTSFRVKIIIGR